ncbi:MAG: hypothetical protein IIW34_01135, partial [Clostridia bacterium]|nr:hypothetical protein [Clostridia bacterium]
PLALNGFILCHCCGHDCSSVCMIEKLLISASSLYPSTPCLSTPFFEKIDLDFDYFDFRSFSRVFSVFIKTHFIFSFSANPLQSQAVKLFTLHPGPLLYQSDLIYEAYFKAFVFHHLKKSNPYSVFSTKYLYPVWLHFKHNNNFLIFCYHLSPFLPIYVDISSFYW